GIGDVDASEPGAHLSDCCPGCERCLAWPTRTHAPGTGTEVGFRKRRDVDPGGRVRFRGRDSGDCPGVGTSGAGQSRMAAAAESLALCDLGLRPAVLVAIIS